MKGESVELVAAIEYLASVIEKASRDITFRLCEFEKSLDEVRNEIGYLRASIRDAHEQG